MSQFDHIKDIAKFGLENDREKLFGALNELIEHSKKTRKVNFALQLQSLLKDSIRHQQISNLKSGTYKHLVNESESDINEFIIEKITSDYRFENLICDDHLKRELKFFIEEHQKIELLQSFSLPVSNKILLHGPSGCGKTLASYVVAGELNKMMIVINLGAIVSSKLGETSKNLSKIFRRAATEDVVLFIDEFDSLGKVRDTNQDHGEMKRVVNTILQLFDYLPQTSIIIAATNQPNMLDSALLRRFDLNIQFELPNIQQIEALISLTLNNGKFEFDNKKSVKTITKSCLGLSYYSIQKTLITAIKRSLFNRESNKTIPFTAKINTSIWKELIVSEKKALIQK